MSPLVLFYSHAPQLEWYGLVARELGRRTGLKTVLWVIGERDRSLAQSIQCFDSVVDLLRGFDPQAAGKNYTENVQFLAGLESKLQAPFLYQDVAIDRHIASRGWPDSTIAAFIRHLWTQMDRQFEALGSLPLAAFGENNTLPYRLAHRRLGPGVPYWNFTVVRHWEGRFFLDNYQSEQWDECRRLFETYRRQGPPPALSQVARDHLQQLRNRQLQPFYMQRSGRGGDALPQKFKGPRVARVLGDWWRELRVRESAANPQAQTPSELSPLHKLRQTFLDLRRKRFFDRVARTRPPAGEDYAAYFLHVQPEYSVEGLAFEFRNQLALLENIAAFLPAHWRLAVKEHKPMVGLRELDFYRDLLRIPNVTLLSDRINSYSVIRGARMVFTLTGTAALEAMYEGIPAVVLGDIFFDCFEGIYKVKSIAELASLIPRLANHPHPGACEEAAVAALAAMHAASHPGRIGAAYTLAEMGQPENLKNIVDVVETELAAVSSAGAE